MSKNCPCRCAKEKGEPFIEHSPARNRVLWNASHRLCNLASSVCPCCSTKQGQVFTDLCSAIQFIDHSPRSMPKTAAGKRCSERRHEKVLSSLPSSALTDTARHHILTDPSIRETEEAVRRAFDQVPMRSMPKKQEVASKMAAQKKASHSSSLSSWAPAAHHSQTRPSCISRPEPFLL